MKQTVAYSLITIALLLVSCKEPADHRGAKNVDSGSRGELIDSTAAMPIGEDRVRSLLAQGSKLYWGLSAARGKEKMKIGENDMVQVDPGKFPSLDKLRDYFRPLFTSSAIDTILTDYEITLHDGKLWMVDEEGDDISIYDETDILETRSTVDSVMLKVEVPLGDSGQTDVLSLRFLRSKGEWKIDSDPYGGEDEE